MKVVALVSGGKDSCMAMLKCMELGHEIVCLATLHPAHANEEMDSFMFQSVGTHIVKYISECMEVPLLTREITGTSLSTELGYHATAGDEVEDLYALLQLAKDQFHVEAVCTGAIFSNYQRIRVEDV